MVPVSSVVMMGVCAAIGIVAPFLLAVWLVKKFNVNPVTIVIGACVFIIFALGLESVLHQIVLKGPAGPSIMGNTLYFALYGGLAAGIFEETGRFVAMKWLLRKRASKALTGIAYGFGHGGVEMLVIFGVSMVSNLVIAIMVDGGHQDLLLATVPEEARDVALAQFAQIEAMTVGGLLIGLWERISAFVLQIGLSLIVWKAVRGGGRWILLFPVAILVHALVDALAVILSKSAGMLAVELIVTALAVAVAASAWLIWRPRRENGPKRAEGPTISQSRGEIPLKPANCTENP